MARRAADPLRQLQRALPKATRVALEEVFWYWLRHVAPARFRREAFAKYPAEFSESAKRDAATWLKRHERAVRKGFADREARPLRARGRLEQGFLAGTVFFTGSNTRLRARWPSLPRYASIRNRYSGFQPSKALVAVAPADVRVLEPLFRDWINANLAKLGNLRGRGFGQYAL